MKENCVILKWNPAISSYSMIRFLQNIVWEKNESDWSIYEYEKVQIVDVNNGSRFETYVISGERGSGMICLNGAAARKAQIGDKIIICSYALMTPEEAKTFKPTVVQIDDNNNIC